MSPQQKPERQQKAKKLLKLSVKKLPEQRRVTCDQYGRGCPDSC